MDKLPEGWTKNNFGTLVENFDGKRIPLSVNERDKRKGNVPYYGASGIIDYIDNFIFEGEFLLISEDGANLLMRTYPIAFIARGKFWVNNHAHIVRAKSNLTSNQYLEYFFSLKDISEYVTGSAQPKLNQRNLNKIPIPLPPLPEQKRIISKLDALFERIDQSIALLEENIKNTEALMASALDEVFGEIDQEKFLPLLEICSPSKETLIPIDNEEYNYVGLENIQSNTGRIINFSRTEGKNIKSTKVRFKRGAVLYGKLRPYLNKVYVADFDGIATTEIMPFQTRKDLLNASFLAYFLRSPRFVALVNQYTSGARMPRATTTFFKKVAKVPVIPLNSQEKIVKKLDSYSKSIEGLLQEQRSKLDNLKSIKESILDNAFKGEL